MDRSRKNQAKLSIFEKILKHSKNFKPPSRRAKNENHKKS